MTKTLLFSALAAIAFTLPASAQLQSETFETATIPTGWTTQHTGPGSWTFGSNIPPFSSNPTFASNAAIFNDDALGSGPTSVASLLSPPIDLTQNNNVINLAFDYYMNELGGGFFKVEAYDGTAWQQLLLAESDVINMTNASYDVTAYKNAAFQVKFTFNDEGAWSWGAAFDNFMLTESLTVKDLRPSASFKLYPNPASNVLHINSNDDMSAVVISDLSGKQLVQHAISGTSGNVDVSALSSGAYIVNATFADGRTQMMKLIKN